jgi:hypothetical protein
LPTILLHGDVKITQERDLLVERDGHVVLNCIEAAKHQVEEGNGYEKLMVELLDHGGEAAASVVEVAEALLELRRLIVLVTVVNRIMQEFPVARSISNETIPVGSTRWTARPLNHGAKLLDVEKIVEGTHFDGCPHWRIARSTERLMAERF